MKREDASAPGYGGNKIRTLETLFGEARRDGVETVWTLGALGSNQALATAIHAPSAGLEAGVVLVPQPPSATAGANLRALAGVLGPRGLARSGLAARVWQLPRPLATVALRRLVAGRRGRLIPPGGATPTGALGHVSGALEVLEQLEAAGAGPPRAVVLPYGSGCTTAGLAAGFALAAALGRLPAGPPVLYAVRISPAFITTRRRVTSLARATARRLEGLGAPRLGAALDAQLRAFRVEGGQLGGGYGHPTHAARRADDVFRRAGAPELDTTYAGKAGAFLLDDLLPSGAVPSDGSVVFWSTKSSAPLPDAGSSLPGALGRWAGRAG